MSGEHRFKSSLMTSSAGDPREREPMKSLHFERKHFMKSPKGRKGRKKLCQLIFKAYFSLQQERNYEIGSSTGKTKWGSLTLAIRQLPSLKSYLLVQSCFPLCFTVLKTLLCKKKTQHKTEVERFLIYNTQGVLQQLVPTYETPQGKYRLKLYQLEVAVLVTILPSLSCE